MCSIPGLPTPGSAVPVLITRVNPNPRCGLLELWVNMDDGREHIYEQMREEIQIPKKKFDGSEGKPGDLCLVCISDTWHRARIVSIQSETYNVFLIDQGQPHTTSSEALAWGQSDSFLLPPEIESCILANILSLENNWPEKATKFLKSLPGKRFKGLVQHVLMPDRIILLDIPIVSKHMCKGGVAKKVPIDEFKCLVLKCLHLPKAMDSEAILITQEQSLNVSCQLEKHDQYFYPELLTDTFESVIVTEVMDPSNIFCKLLIFSTAVKILSEQLHQHYKESSDLGEAKPLTCGDPCAARGLNGIWYRSLLRQDMTSDGTVEVLHVDEGKMEEVPVGDVKPLHEKFLKMPVVTYRCSLEGVKGRGWITDQTEYLKSLLLHQTVMARFDHHNISQEVYSVTLYAGNVACINSYFIERAELSQPSMMEEDVQHEPISPSFLSVLGEEQCMDVLSNVNADGLQEETLPSTKNLMVNGRTDDIPASSNIDMHIKDGAGHPEPLVQSNGHLSVGFPSEVQNDHDKFTVGSSINVNISCIESLQKFWCQKRDNTHFLRLLMEDLQKHYASVHPQPIVDSVFVARNPVNNMWYRARIIESHHSPVVEVRFIDYGQTGKVCLRDVRPIDPAFLRLNAQAFQCCLFNPKNPTDPTAVTWSDPALTEFCKFVESDASSDPELKCIMKAVTSDEEGLLLKVVDIETLSDSASKRCAQAETQAHIPSHIPSDAYCYSTHNIEVGGREKVWVTFSDSVNHFYCQLDRNSHLLKAVENVQQLPGQTWCKDWAFGLNSICLAKYTDNQWYRGQVVEVSPKLMVNFVDYGQTLALNESDICPFPTEASFAKTVPVQAVPLGLSGVPEEVPQEVNQWFADCAISHSLTMSVVTRGEKGKLLVELFDGSLNVNAEVRKRISQMTQQKMTRPIPQTEQLLSKILKHTGQTDDKCLTQEVINLSETNMTKQSEVDKSNGVFIGHELKISSPSIDGVSSPEINHENSRNPMLDVILEEKETALAETFEQVGSSDSEVTQLSLPSCPEEGVQICMYNRPTISLNKTEEVYASCIVGPNYFWCQCTKTEDLDIVSKLAQEGGQAQKDMIFTKPLDPGSPCLALFPGDDQWYRAQVIQRTNKTLHVVYMDYGNESDVDIQDVRPLPQNLLEKAPQSFLCSLSGFDESKGSWDDDVYEDFYSLLVNKPLKVTVFNIEDHSEIAVPQYAVQIECENMIVNDAMLKYWKPVATHVTEENPQTEDLPLDGQTVSYTTNPNVSKENVTIYEYKNPNISTNKKEEVFASCIVDPHFFWCQYANAEELSKVSSLAQEAGQAPQDIIFSKSLGPGSPCLALFSNDEQWYRALVIHRVNEAFHVVFIDYGNESDVDIKDVRPLPQSLLEKAPQAFLCSLNGFDESSGSWDDEVYEDFYSLLIDKPLELTLIDMKDHSEIAVFQHVVKIECKGVVVNAAMQKYWKSLAKEHVLMENPQTETFSQDGETNCSMIHLSVPKGNLNSGMYKKPNIFRNKTEMVYASCIVDPHFFWCQYANTEELNRVSRLAQEAGQAPQDIISLKTLDPGSPCLALFSSDDQWYRAQVIHRADDIFHVVFMDYGNESDVDIKDVRPLPQSLLDMAPQAFLCSLNGFDESRGSWDDEVCDDFYQLLVDKPLEVMVLNIKDHSENELPQHEVEIQCEGVVINAAIQKYWRPVAKERVLKENPQTETSLQDDQTKSNMTHASVSKGNVDKCMYKDPNISKNKTEMVYASCIVDPHFFWCQYANSEELNNVTRLAQDAGQTPQDIMFSQTLGPGSPCLALFSSDDQWYRAQVIHKADNLFHVVFIDYGNESDVDIKDVRPLPQSLLDMAPQAFLCFLGGFVKSEGSWDDKAYDDFYSLLVDKPLELTMINMDSHSEIALPHYAVQIECDGVVVNTLMVKYWKRLDTNHTLTEVWDEWTGTRKNVEN